MLTPKSKSTQSEQPSRTINLSSKKLSNSRQKSESKIISLPRINPNRKPNTNEYLHMIKGKGPKATATIKFAYGLRTPEKLRYRSFSPVDAAPSFYSKDLQKHRSRQPSPVDVDSLRGNTQNLSHLLKARGNGGSANLGQVRFETGLRQYQKPNRPPKRWNSTPYFEKLHDLDNPYSQKNRHVDLPKYKNQQAAQPGKDHRHLFRGGFGQAELNWALRLRT